MGRDYDEHMESDIQFACESRRSVIKAGCKTESDKMKSRTSVAEGETKMNTFAGIERMKALLLIERARRAKEHADWLADCSQRLKTLDERTSLLTDGVDLVRIDRARQVLAVQGDATKVVLDSDRRHGGDVRPNAITDAKRWLAESPQRLKEKYVGVKNYSGFGDQREDHQYGMGPRHGSIVFSIGLTPDARKRDLTADEIEDALYLLHVLPALAKAQKMAA